MNMLRDAKIAAGLCSICGGIRDCATLTCSACKAREADKRKQRRKAKAADGICFNCGGPRDGETERCSTCTAELAEKRKKAKDQSTRELRRAAGQCLSCGGTPEAGQLLCAPCREKQREYQQAFRALRDVSNICINCSKPRDRDTQLCSSCMAAATKASTANRERRKADTSRCMQCQKPRWFSAPTCAYHYVKSITHNYKLPKEHIETLVKRLEDTDFRCTYTGIKLVPGINTSIDHVISEKDDPSRVIDPNNLVWCDRGINDMKTRYSIPALFSIFRVFFPDESRLMRLHSIVANKDSIPLDVLHSSNHAPVPNMPPTLARFRAESRLRRIAKSMTSYKLF